jgi:hypothetical protein
MLRHPELKIRQHLPCMLEGDLLWQRIQRKPSHVAGTITGVRFTVSPTDEVDIQNCVTFPLKRVMIHVKTQKSQIIHGKACFFTDLAECTLLRKLFWAQKAARNIPETLKRRKVAS